MLSDSNDPSRLSESSFSCSHIDKVTAKLKKCGYNHLISLGTVTRPEDNKLSRVIISRGTSASPSLILCRVLALVEGLKTVDYMF